MVPQWENGDVGDGYEISLQRKPKKYFLSFWCAQSYTKWLFSTVYNKHCLLRVFSLAQSKVCFNTSPPFPSHAVVWGGEETGSRNETKCSCGHLCSPSPAPGEALLKGLTALKSAGIAEKMHRRKSPGTKHLFLMWRKPITECKTDPAVPSLWRCAERSEWTLTPESLVLFSDAFCTQMAQRYLLLRGQVRDLLFTWSSAQAV